MNINEPEEKIYFPPGSTKIKYNQGITPRDDQENRGSKKEISLHSIGLQDKIIFRRI